MGLLLQLNHLVEVLNVNVGVDSEQSFQYSLGNTQEVLGKWHANGRGENGLVVNLGLDPVHKVVDVAWRRTLDWLLDYLAVCPVIAEWE